MHTNTSSNTLTVGAAATSPPDAEVAALYAHYYPTIFRRIFALLGGRTGQREQAEDLTQETFLKAYRALPSRRPGPMSAWLSQIALNTVRDQWRRNQLVAFCSLDREHVPDPVDERADPQYGCGERELIQATLRQLTPSHRRVLIAWANGHTYNRQVLYRARSAFKHAYVQALGEGGGIVQ